MNDRELLELAAKAVGLKYIKPTNDYNGGLGLVLCDEHDRPVVDWRPITDDGDALRLAVKLGLLVHGLDSSSAVFCQVGECPNAFLEHAKPDPYAATRRAIVRAAAEIGKEMK